MNSGSGYLRRSQSGARRRICKVKGPEWIERKFGQHDPNLSASTENVAPVSNQSTHSIPESTEFGTEPQQAYRSLIDNQGYRSLLPDLEEQRQVEFERQKRLELEEKFRDWNLQSTFSSSPVSSTSTIQLQTFNMPKSKPTPLPRVEKERERSSPVITTLPSRENMSHSSSDSANGSVLSTNDSFSSLNQSMDQPPPLPPASHKPMLQVHPLPVPRSRPQPPPIPEKPKNLQVSKFNTLNSFSSDLGSEKSSNSSSQASFSLDPEGVTYSMDDDSLNKLEKVRVERLKTLYKLVSGRLDDLQNVQQEKSKNTELFQQIVNIAQDRNVPTAPFVRFIKRFEMVYEVQTRLMINKQNLENKIEDSKDEEFIKPLIERNEQNLRDMEKLVDELDQTFQSLDGQLCQVLEQEEHEIWVFFVRTLYSLIAEESSIQSKVRLVYEQIRKLENFSFNQIIKTRITPSLSQSTQTKSSLSLGGLNISQLLSNSPTVSTEIST
ncbi:unnamed protein product [Bursaphelenchus xylophilus]|uniref:(pine wood nematode) hypothetical protein n=1 Tax=Bursaphelenchus xylophilus TaxID=6326 RepID=A0A811L3S3_BURXY|nr:unnamed protein product [Bursaphelenchus xylophilus]CAG9109403.1 unnamed protein product [Bursaphelenchus xylophilus]